MYVAVKEKFDALDIVVPVYKSTFPFVLIRAVFISPYAFVTIAGVSSFGRYFAAIVTYVRQLPDATDVAFPVDRIVTTLPLRRATRFPAFIAVLVYVSSDTPIDTCIHVPYVHVVLVL